MSLRRLIRWLGFHDELIIAAIVLISLGTFGFVKLMGEVREGETQRFDEYWMRAIGGYQGPHWLEEMGRDITALGGVVVLTIVTLIVVGFLMLRRMWGAMWLLIAATVGGAIASGVLKYLVDRPRPDIVPHRSYIMTTSFPSGHSMLSAVVYLTLGSLLARFTNDTRLRLYFLFVACALSFLVGISRIYMGVHWPTDVMAGWAAGAVWAMICWMIARWLQRRGAVESDIPAADQTA